MADQSRSPGVLRLVRRVSRQWLAIATVALVAMAAVVAACADSSDNGFTNPTTGILVRAESVTAGKGCGTAATNVYKYAVVVFGYTAGPATDRASYTFPLYGNVYDCFADGEFINLPAVAGSFTYRLEVYAFNRAAYDASRGVIEGAAGNCATTGCTNTDASTGLPSASPTWTTVCTATQQPQVETLAFCDPLSAGLSGLSGGSVGATGLTLATSSFNLPGNRLASCGPGLFDAGSPVDAGDAGRDAGDGGDAGDAGDAGEVDAGPLEVPFATARIRYRIGATVGPTVDLACPAPYQAQVASEAAVYAVDVGLLDSAGTLVGQTVCQGTAVPGQETAIVCP